MLNSFRKQNVRLATLLTSILVSAVGSVSHADWIGSPLCNPYRATALGALLKESVNHDTGLPNITFKTMSVTFHPGRNPLLGLSESTRIDMPFLLGKKDAPIVYILSGLGSSGWSGYSRFLMEELNNMGFTAISIPSTFYDRGAMNLSRYVRPGLPSEDVADINELIKVARERLIYSYGLTPKAHHLMGVSLGAYHTGVIAADPKLQAQFQKYILINPPMDIRYGLAVLDRFAGAKNIDDEQAAQQINSLYKIKAIGDGKLRKIIGKLLSSSVQNLVAASQLYQDDGLMRETSIGGRYQESKNWSIKNYFDLIALPFHQKLAEERNEVLNLDQELSLWHHLFRAARPTDVLVMHSKDDFISDPNEVPKLRFMNHINYVVSNCGGHVGALPYKVFMKPLRKFMTR